MKKRIIFFSIGFSSLSIILYVVYNLVHHSVYYAHHMPHAAGTNPEMVMAIKHLWEIPRPDGDDLSYDDDGRNTIVREDGFLTTGDGGGYQIFIRRKSEDDIYVYQYGPNGQLYNYKRGIFRMDMVEGNQSSRKLIQKFIGPIIRYQKAPKINLQLLFNFLNEGMYREERR